MAGERTIRIKFDGSAKGLTRAAAVAAKEIDGVESTVKKKAGVFARLGQKIGLDFTDGISGAFKGLPPQVQAVAATAAVAIGGVMAHVIGAAISSAVLLGVGGGVLAAGIIAAAKSPKVKAAWATFGERAKKAFANFGKPFEGPLIRAAKTFGDALERMAPTLNEMGKSMAPIIDKLAPAFASLAEKSLPGIKKAMEASKPLFDKLAEHMPKIGEAISKFFEEIAKGGPGAEGFFERFLQAIEVLLPVLGKVLGWLSNLFLTIDMGAVKAQKAFLTLGVKVTDVFGTILDGAAVAFSWMPELGPKLAEAAAKFNTFRDKANAALAGIKDEEIRLYIERAETGMGKAPGSKQGMGRRRAGGGRVLANRSYLVGENGPEEWTPDRNGTITPNHRLGPDVLQLTLDLGEGIRQVVNINLRERDRGLKRRVMAGAGAR